MPLKRGKSRKVISNNIHEMVAAGHPVRVAVAAALHNAARHYAEGGDVPGEDDLDSIEGGGGWGALAQLLGHGESLVHQIIPPSVPGAPAPAVPPAITAKGAEVAPAEPASLMGTGTLAARNSMAQAELDDENMDFGKAWLEEEARVPKAHKAPPGTTTIVKQALKPQDDSVLRAVLRDQSANRFVAGPNDSVPEASFLPMDMQNPGNFDPLHETPKVIRDVLANQRPRKPSLQAPYDPLQGDTAINNNMWEQANPTMARVLKEQARNEAAQLDRQGLAQPGAQGLATPNNVGSIFNPNPLRSPNPLQWEGLGGPLAMRGTPTEPTATSDLTGTAAANKIEALQNKLNVGRQPASGPTVPITNPFDRNYYRQQIRDLAANIPTPEDEGNETGPVIFNRRQVTGNESALDPNSLFSMERQPDLYPRDMGESTTEMAGIYAPGQFVRTPGGIHVQFEREPVPSTTPGEGPGQWINPRAEFGRGNPRVWVWDRAPSVTAPTTPEGIHLDEGDQASFDRRVALRRAALPPEAAQGWQPQLKLPGGVGKLNEAQPQPPQANNLPTDLPTDTNMRIAALKQLGTNNPAALEAARALIGRQQLEGQAQGNLPIQPALHLQRDLSHGPLLNPLGPPQGAPADILAKLQQGAPAPIAKGEPGGLTFNKALGRWTTDQPTTDTLPKTLALASGEYQSKLPGIGGSPWQNTAIDGSLMQTLPKADWNGTNKIKLGRQSEGGINQSWHIPNLQDPSGLHDWYAKTTDSYGQGNEDAELATLRLGRSLGLNYAPVVDLGDGAPHGFGRGRTIIQPWIPHTKFKDDDQRADQAIAAMSPQDRTKQLLFEHLIADQDKHGGNFGATIEPEGQPPQLLNFDYGGALGGGNLASNAYAKRLFNNHPDEVIDKGAAAEVAAKRTEAIAAFKQAGADRDNLKGLSSRFDVLDSIVKANKPITYKEFIKKVNQW